MVVRCVEELGLIALEKEDGISSGSMAECCVRLLQVAPQIQHLTHGNHILVGSYYSVSAEGVICIPWNWVSEGERERKGNRGEMSE